MYVFKNIPIKMSMNSFMHPRNKYKNPPDFTLLAVSYPEFRDIGTLDVNGKVKVDFKNDKTLRVLTKCLLKKDFDLDVHLPPDKLVPTLPLRLNYILWLEDILEVVGIKHILGIDIGCGASCIYSLLAARKNNWNMLALETNAASYAYAVANVASNALNLLIKVIHQPDDSLIFGHAIPTNVDGMIHFCMCNPPFFSRLDDSEHNGKKNRTGKRPLPKNSKTGSTDELIVDGGESEFVEKIINESCILRDRIKVYTTMLGHKSSLPIVLSYLGAKGITNITRTEFCQGQTTRWGVAWSFDPNVLLRTVPTYGPSAPRKKCFTYDVPNDGMVSDVSDVLKKLKEIFNRINIKLENVQYFGPDVMTCRMVAMCNTWSKQRRKRRELERAQFPNFEYSCSTENESMYDQRNNPEPKSPTIAGNVMYSTEINVPVLVVNVRVCKHPTKGIAIKLEYLSGRAEVNGVYQVLQFIRNNWKPNVQ